MNVEQLVDCFVKKVNEGHLEPMMKDEVPTFLQDGESDGDFIGWKIVSRNNSPQVEALVGKLPKRFPPSFYYFLSHYSFPAFEASDLMFFANTGGDDYWELSKRMFADPHMSPILLKAGFLQIGNPFFHNYDPVCFDTTKGKQEYPLVQLDHESALQFGEIKMVKEIAPSFVEFLNKVVGNVAA